MKCKQETLRLLVLPKYIFGILFLYPFSENKIHKGLRYFNALASLKFCVPRSICETTTKMNLFTVLRKMLWL